MRLKFKLLLLGFLIIVATIPGVFANWLYTFDFVENKQTDVNLGVNAFEYAPEEVLPGDEEDTQIGHNHLELIEKILNEVSYGLNATKKPIIHNLLNKVGDVVYCQQNVQGGNLKHLMIDGTGAYDLLFQIEYVDENTYITYTYVHGDILTVPLGDRIYAYKTTMSRGNNGVWTAPTSFYGSAVVMRSPISSSIRGLDSSTWIND